MHTDIIFQIEIGILFDLFYWKLGFDPIKKRNKVVFQLITDKITFYSKI